MFRPLRRGSDLDCQWLATLVATTLVWLKGSVPFPVTRKSTTAANGLLRRCSAVGCLSQLTHSCSFPQQIGGRDGLFRCGWHRTVWGVKDLRCEAGDAMCSSNLKTRWLLHTCGGSVGHLVERYRLPASTANSEFTALAAVADTTVTARRWRQMCRCSAPTESL